MSNSFNSRIKNSRLRIVYFSTVNLKFTQILYIKYVLFRIT